MTHHFIYRCFTLLCILPLFACGESTGNSSTQTAGKPVTAQAKKNITAKLEKTYAAQNLKVLSVETAPLAGLYEVLLSGNQLVYVDGNADHMLVGELLDINNMKSLSEERLAEITKVDFTALPFDKSIREVRGKGERKIAVFTDTDCPYCKRLESEFAKMDNLTIDNFMMPIPSLHPQAQAKSEQLWCQPNRTKAWTDWMRNQIAPPTVPACPNPIAETMRLGQTLGFNGTPTLVFPNGKVFSGFMEQENLEKAITENQ
ncbi:DsbC family protein [Stenoxybacter acetivorans]|uniref:DsbC family protein n=1 Tax=Stenoxybacter acetivorans TaxID=422441 RepID=UPI00068CA5D4|nr:DsbC family protein [Stenoxybacter acetivorans]